MIFLLLYLVITAFMIGFFCYLCAAAKDDQFMTAIFCGLLWPILFPVYIGMCLGARKK